jgi:hypothetical protein
MLTLAPSVIPLFQIYPISFSDDKPKSTLSAEAKEWFPPNYVPPATDVYYNRGNSDYYNNYHNYGNHVYYQHQPSYDHHHNYGGQRYSAQNRLQYHRRNEENQLQVNNFIRESFDRYSIVFLQDSLTQLMGMLDEVTFSPGRFASLSGPLVDSFTATLNDVQHTQPLVDAIVNQVYTPRAHPSSFIYAIFIRRQSKNRTSDTTPLDCVLCSIVLNLNSRRLRYSEHVC